ncbi:hypothetical protein QNI16_35840 [Cytophagaceae bacterium YF14B1]|uniref:Uncharacterized protein n=1 Tax=Xanthocytophaga flava TaxID=3048013 RepID=A0AAE3UA88_9BACT|nr:hypothetical protein [Xanthocytophaga flavus]MDJ1485909.1 hypothetical protein [Xanthocytophaga flavus]
MSLVTYALPHFVSFLLTQPMPLTQQDIQRIKHQMSAKYDVNFDKELLPLICEMIETKEHLDSQTQQLKDSLDAATALLNKKSTQSAQNVYQNNYQTNWQSFWHGFGTIGLPATLAVISLFVGYLLWFNRTEQAKLADNIQVFLKEHKQIASFGDLSDYQIVQNLKIGNQTLEYVQLPVVPNIRQALPGKNVVVEFKKSRGGKATEASIKIPLRIVNK